ncbi:MAG TPA: acyl-CoA thioesterase domain-containing protein [Dermatophilaceae bacterium]|nr:acyl-CoA thioesterase domain-containing protein [Dermatophilaceae bacterium]
MSEYAFTRAIAVSPTSRPAVFQARLDRAWTIHGGPINGGVTLALATNALANRFGAAFGHADPLCVSALYLTAALPGPATVYTKLLRRGGSISSGQASLMQVDAQGRDVERTRVIATLGGLSGATDGVATVARPPQLPDPVNCLGSDDLPRALVEETELMERYEVRLDPATSGWLHGQPSGLGRLRAWFRMRDGMEPTPPDADPGRGRASSSRLRPRRLRLGADPRTDRACTGPAHAWLAADRVVLGQPRRRADRGGRRDLGLPVTGW